MGEGKKFKSVELGVELGEVEGTEGTLGRGFPGILNLVLTVHTQAGLALVAEPFLMGCLIW